MELVGLPEAEKALNEMQEKLVELEERLFRENQILHIKLERYEKRLKKEMKGLEERCKLRAQSVVESTTT